jgi:hypothetical protein
MSKDKTRIELLEGPSISRSFALSRIGPSHGHAIAQQIRRVSEEAAEQSKWEQLSIAVATVLQPAE